MSNRKLRATLIAGAVLSVVILAIAAISPSNISVLAGTSQQYVVTPSVGLNVRDKNCKRIGYLKFNTTISADPNQSIECTINGVKYVMFKKTDADTEQYVAKNFIRPKTAANNPGASKFNPQGKAVVNSAVGLNFRDDKCNLCETVQRVPYRKTVSKASDNTITCNIRGVDYKMVNVNYDGKTGYVAEQFLIPA